MGWVQTEVKFVEPNGVDRLTVDVVSHYVRFQVNGGPTVIIPRNDLDTLIALLNNAKG